MEPKVLKRSVILESLYHSSMTREQLMKKWWMHIDSNNELETIIEAFKAVGYVEEVDGLLHLTEIIRREFNGKTSTSTLVH